MSKNYGNDSQIAEIVKYISDTMKLPVMGAGGGFAPIGTINFFDASIAPQGWLACDGTVYNITDYPDLATFYASVHGSTNFYGGNGTTTFAVPDLRGEFLRGAGTNGHTNQGSGGSVGEHQDGTEHTSLGTGSDFTIIYSAVTSNGQATKDVGNKDSVKNLNKGSWQKRGGGDAYNDNDVPDTYTSRPTNTSFLICIKATVSGDANAHQYSTEEQVVGKWVDGSTIYEKTIDVNFTLSAQDWAWTATGVTASSLNIDKLISAKYWQSGNNQPYHGTVNVLLTSVYENETGRPIKVFGFCGIDVSRMTIQYTKTQ